MKKLIFILSILSLNSKLLFSQETELVIQKGNEFYKQKQYDKAEAAYDEVIAKDPGNTTAKFNKANAQFRANKANEAIKTLDDIAANSEDKKIDARASYNKGAILSNQKKLEESIDAYKEALRKDPADKEARENLQKALTELKKKNPPKKQDKKQDQQKKQQQQPKMNQKEAEQRLKLLEQKEKDVQQRLQKERSKQGGGQPKDW
jgi:tetratricopeptide (TPR) repeat protein